MSLRTKTVLHGNIPWTYNIFRATPKKFLCQSLMKSKNCESITQTLRGFAATRRWWKEKTGQDFDPCPKAIEHNWVDISNMETPADQIHSVCNMCGEHKTERRQ